MRIPGAAPSGCLSWSAGLRFADQHLREIRSERRRTLTFWRATSLAVTTRATSTKSSTCSGCGVRSRLRGRGRACRAGAHPRSGSQAVSRLQSCQERRHEVLGERRVSEERNRLLRASRSLPDRPRLPCRPGPECHTRGSVTPRALAAVRRPKLRAQTSAASR
jgi:hypothetical protein